MEQWFLYVRDEFGNEKKIGSMLLNTTKMPSVTITDSNFIWVAGKAEKLWQREFLTIPAGMPPDDTPREIFSETLKMINRNSREFPLAFLYNLKKIYGIHARSN